MDRANFRRGGYLDHADRYIHAEAFVETAKKIWDSWEDGAVSSSVSADSWAVPGHARRVHHSGQHYSVDVTPRLPRSAQYRPVLFQAGDSPEGRDFAARQADVIFSAHPKFDDAAEFRADIVSRSLAAGRGANDVQIMPASEFILAATDEEAREKKEWVRGLQIGPQQAVAYLEQFWAGSCPPTIPMVRFRRSIRWWRRPPRPGGAASTGPKPGSSPSNGAPKLPRRGCRSGSS
ncbi:nitrilotriacetate monooxygenase component A [Arthrobacter sp. Hiyo8]|nr:nitrilotriacetate monooxygenase component A [Arthrobacter sp. Hiyo8]